jgi:hypothetical protein
LKSLSASSAKLMTTDALETLPALIEQACAASAWVGLSQADERGPTPTIVGTSMEPHGLKSALPSNNANANYGSYFKQLVLVEPDGIEPTTSSMPL